MTADRIGRYEIVHEIARGGMAIVYLAKDTFMERLVAVKVLPRVFMHDPQFEKRFTREARVVASLEHPAIVPVYDFGYQEDQPFMVYRYMSGGTLKDKIENEGAKSIDDTFTFISRITPAIDKAHDGGIIHRDLKPSNILFDDDNKAYVADFGIAKIVESTSHLTGNAIVGTPAYMSPEQFTGDVEVGRYSDIYALGIILYELLSGELPFKADTTPRLMKLHIMDPVPSIREIRAELPKEIDAILEKTLAKSSENRFQRVEDLRGAFESVIRVRPTLPDPADDQQYGDEETTTVEPEILRRQDETTIDPIVVMDDEDKAEVEAVPSDPKIKVEAGVSEDAAPGFKLPQIPFPVVVLNLRQILKQKDFLSVTIVALGWLVGHLTGSYIMSIDPLNVLGTVFLLVGAFGGIALALSSKWIMPELNWLKVLSIAGGWLVSWGLLWTISEALNISPSWDLDFVALQTFASMVAGTITGLSLFWNDQAERWKRTVIVILGWGAATLIGVLFNAHMNLEGWLKDYYIIDRFISVDGLFAYSIIGAIGSGVTIWQIKKSSISAKIPKRLDFSDTVLYLLKRDWVVLVLLLIGWPISEVLLQVVFKLMNGDTTLIYLINGGVAALFLGLAIKRLKTDFGWSHILAITLAWMLLWEGRWHLANAIGIELGQTGGWFLLRLVASAAAGGITGVVLKFVLPTMNWTRVIPVSASWVLGWGISSAIAGYFISTNQWITHWETPIATFSYFWILVAPLVGLIGGVSTVREILNAEGVDTSPGKISPST
jgi:serine/threonine protein kinase